MGEGSTRSAEEPGTDGNVDEEMIYRWCVGMRKNRGVKGRS